MNKTLRNWLIYIIFVVAVLALFWAISGQRAPYIPPDDDHLRMEAEALCRECHAPGKEAPLVSQHPPKEMCFECHKRKKKI